MALTEKVFDRKYLWPAELKRGIRVGWKPNYTVLVTGDSWSEAYDWLRNNATGLWMDHIYQPEYLVGFEKEEDAVAFKLRWL